MTYFISALICLFSCQICLRYRRKVKHINVDEDYIQLCIHVKSFQANNSGHNRGDNFKSKCIYGCHNMTEGLEWILYMALCFLYGNACNHLYTTWNIAVRRLYELPRTAHTRLLCNITNLPHIKHNLKCRFIKFDNNATKSWNKKVKFLANMFISNNIFLHKVPATDKTRWKPLK